MSRGAGRRLLAAIALIALPVRRARRRDGGAGPRRRAAQLSRAVCRRSRPRGARAAAADRAARHVDARLSTCSTTPTCRPGGQARRLRAGISPAALGQRLQRRPGAAPGSDAAAVDDVGFIEAAAADARQRFGVRADAIYVVGFSNGGSMVQRLAIESRYPFAGFAAVASAPRVHTGACAAGAAAAGVRHGRPVEPGATADGCGCRWCTASRRRPPPCGNGAQRLQLPTATPEPAAPAAGVSALLLAAAAPTAHAWRWITIDGLGHHWAGARPMPFPRFVLGPQLDTPKLGELVWSFLAAPTR